MPVTRAQLLEALETSFFIYPETPGLLTRVPVHGVRGRVTPLSHPLLNLVGAASLDERTADQAIREVHQYFVQEQKAYGWLTGSHSRPADLPARLRSAGLTEAAALAGMALMDLSQAVPSNPDVSVCEVPAGEFRAHSALLAESYGLPGEVAAYLTEMLAQAGDVLRGRAYLAYVRGHDAPVAFGNLFHLPGSALVLLGGAATLAAYRGRGVYSSMVARRLADARADGAEAAIVQAVRDTSAPICASLGFEEIGALEMFAWSPEV